METALGELFVIQHRTDIPMRRGAEISVILTEGGSAWFADRRIPAILPLIPRTGIPTITV